ncbi:hypothetical protein LINGRAHAP2_LOCUS34770 [Linum grandiflorum]
MSGRGSIATDFLNTTTNRKLVITDSHNSDEQGATTTVKYVNKTTTNLDLIVLLPHCWIACWLMLSADLQEFVTMIFRFQA